MLLAVTVTLTVHVPLAMPMPLAVEEEEARISFGIRWKIDESWIQFDSIEPFDPPLDCS
jgi:hypothetical protein